MDYLCISAQFSHYTGHESQRKKSWGNKFVRYRLYYNLFSFFALVALLYYQLTIPTIRLFDPSLVVQCIGIIFSAFGVFIMIRCIKNYFFSLSGLRSLVREEGDEAGPLLITGIHQYVRHPLYLGTFLFVWSMLLVFPYLSLLIANVVITIYTLIGIELEEKNWLPALVMHTGIISVRCQRFCRGYTAKNAIHRNNHNFCRKGLPC